MKKEWLRPTQISKKFPEEKYGFTKHLVSIGDEVETFPMSYKESMDIKYAAYFWAYYRGWTIRVKRTKCAPDKWYVRVTLMQKHRIRDFS